MTTPDGYIYLSSHDSYFFLCKFTDDQKIVTVQRALHKRIRSGVTTIKSIAVKLKQGV